MLNDGILKKRLDHSSIAVVGRSGLTFQLLSVRILMISKRTVESVARWQSTEEALPSTNPRPREQARLGTNPWKTLNTLYLNLLNHTVNEEVVTDSLSV